jgi:GT2 family glycosyltransferase
MTVSVIIVTVERPECVRRCLDCLLAQDPLPDQIIVVDASRDDRTKDVVDQSPSVLYVRNPQGKGCTPRSRNLGLQHATGDIIAWVDDDAYAHPGWLAGILAPYADDTVGGVGGRALQRRPGEEFEGVNEIGLVKSDGSITGNFAADPGKLVEVDHFIGCNMSFRSEVFVNLGACNEEYRGAALCEETDICVRARRIGYRLVFNPAAVVDHIGAPRVVGRRFGYHYQCTMQRNHLIFLMRHYGPASPIIPRFLAMKLKNQVLAPHRQIVEATLSTVVLLLGTVSGLARGLAVSLVERCNPVRNDAASALIRQQLTRVNGTHAEACVAGAPIYHLLPTGTRQVSGQPTCPPSAERNHAPEGRR